MQMTDDEMAVFEKVNQIGKKNRMYDMLEAAKADYEDSDIRFLLIQIRDAIMHPKWDLAPLSLTGVSRYDAETEFWREHKITERMNYSDAEVKRRWGIPEDVRFPYDDGMTSEVFSSNDDTCHPEDLKEGYGLYYVYHATTPFEMMVDYERELDKLADDVFAFSDKYDLCAEVSPKSWYESERYRIAIYKE